MLTTSSFWFTSFSLIVLLPVWGESAAFVDHVNAVEAAGVFGVRALGSGRAALCMSTQFGIGREVAGSLFVR
jgi:hypothetical protein